MKRVLIVASVPSMIGQFNMSNIKILQEMQYKVEVACNFEDRTVWDETKISELKKELNSKEVQFYPIDFVRNAFGVLKHVRAYKQLKNLVHKKKYDMIHCHTPIAAMIARVVAHQERVKIIYTAHGFHFFKGAPMKNWLLYYPVEKFLSRWTDCLITINREDYHRAKRKFRAKRTEYVPGVGVDTKKFGKPSEKETLEIKEEKRKELGLNMDDFVIVSVGELNENKNHQVIIKAIAKMKNKKVKYLICGRGELQEKLLYLIREYGLEEQVFLLGFRNDIADIMKMADIYCLPSLREGLNVSLMEAIASGLPCIASDIRGNRDLLRKECLIPPDKPEVWRKSIKVIKENQTKEKVESKTFNFSKTEVMKKMKKIYRILLVD